VRHVCRLINSHRRRGPPVKGEKCGGKRRRPRRPLVCRVGARRLWERAAPHRPGIAGPLSILPACCESRARQSFIACDCPAGSESLRSCARAPRCVRRCVFAALGLARARRGRRGGGWGGAGGRRRTAGRCRNRRRHGAARAARMVLRGESGSCEQGNAASREKERLGRHRRLPVQRDHEHRWV